MLRDKLSSTEFELVITELSERLKDMVFCKAEGAVRSVMGHCHKSILSEKDTNEFTVKFSIQFIAGDIQQIVARKRRGSKEKSNTSI